MPPQIQDEEQEDQSQDQEQDPGQAFTIPANVATLPNGQQAPPGAPMMPTGQRPVSVRPPMAAPGGVPVFSPEQQQSRAFWRQMQAQTQDMPLDQAEQAVTAALKFQAMRGYQKDLEDGKSAGESLAKWAPMLFPKSSMGNAAQMIRASQPRPPALRTAGGRIFQVDGGQATPLTPAPTREPKADQFALAAFRQKLTEIKRLEDDLDIAEQKDKPELQNRIARAKREAEGIRTGDSGQADSDLPPKPKAGKGGNEVVRMTKDGRKAVFDSDTRKFLRYAQ
jgi:hypothetical protein